MKITIVRDPALSDANGTFGTLTIDTDTTLSFRTVEQPWDNNIPDRSCIPVGDYELRPYNSPAHGPTVVFHNPALGIYGTPDLIPVGTEGRSLCEIHSANWPFQLKGCVAVGLQVQDIPPNGRGVTASRTALARLERLWGDRSDLTASISNGDGASVSV